MPKILLGSREILTGDAAEKAEKRLSLLMEVPEMRTPFVIFEMIGTRVDPEPHNKGRILAPRSWNVPDSTNVRLGPEGKDMDRLYWVPDAVPNPNGQGNYYPYGEILFDKGTCMIPRYDKATYQYLMLHPENKKNAEYYGHIQSTFYMVDTNSTKSDAYDAERKQFDVLSRFMNIKSIPVIIIFAMSIQVNTNQDLAAIKYDCTQRLKKDPALIDLLDGPDMIYKAIVFQAFDMSIISKHPSSQEIGYTGPQNSFTRITTIPIGTQNYKEYFVNWLKEDMTGTYTVLRKKVEIAGGTIEAKEEDTEIPEPIVIQNKEEEAVRLQKQNDAMLKDMGVSPSGTSDAPFEIPKNMKLGPDNKLVRKSPQDYANEKKAEREQALIDANNKEQEPGTGRVVGTEE